MDSKQEVLKSTGGQLESQAVLPLATVSLDLKSERVQESFAAGPAPVVSLKLELAVHQPQTVTVVVSGVSTAFTFDNQAAPAAAAAA